MAAARLDHYYSTYINVLGVIFELQELDLELLSMPQGIQCLDSKPPAGPGLISYVY